MSTLKISRPASLRSFVEEQAAERGFETPSAYVAELIRHDRDRQQLKSLLLEGGESTPSIAADAMHFEALRAGVSSPPRVGAGR